MTDIALLIPSKGRPDRLRRCIETALAAAKEPGRIKLYAGIEGDEQSDEYISMASEFDLELVLGEFGSSVAAWNALASRALHDRDTNVFHMTADDLEFHEGWDQHVREIYETFDGPWILHYRDDYRNEARACNPFVTRAYIKDYGFLPPELKHFYSDEWLEAMGRLGGCLLYSPSIHIVHMHPKEGRAEWDDTYINPRKPKRVNADAAAWEALQEKLRHESARLRRQVKPELRLVWSKCETPSEQQPSPSDFSPSPASA